MINFLSFLFRLLYIVAHGIVVRKRETRWAKVQLRNIEMKLQQHLNGFTFKKIVNSYALFVPLISDGYAQLHGRNTNRMEKERLLHYFICSSLFDDFCDRVDCQDERLWKLSFNSENVIAVNGDEEIFLYAHNFLRRQFAGLKLAYYDDVSLKIFHSQNESEKQFDPTITNEDIARITKEKGGHSLLITNCYLDISFSQQENDCCFYMGFLIQLTNDIFDIYKDIHDESEGSATLPNRMENAIKFRNYFASVIQEFQEKIWGIHIDAKNIKSFHIRMMALCALGLTGIHQFVLLQEKQGRLPPLKNLSRKETIIDMERWHTFQYWFTSTYRESKKLQHPPRKS